MAFAVGFTPSWGFVPVATLIGLVLFEWLIPEESQPLNIEMEEFLASFQQETVEKVNIDSILLCPGFAHNEVAEIVEAAGGNVAVAVAVARGDGPSGRVSKAARVREGYMGKKKEN